MDEVPYCRLTVLAPRRRVDVSLPSDVPVAELVAMVLELVGEPDRARTARPEPWRLSGAAGGLLPVTATLDELGVLDGELLRLGPVTPAPAPPVFDDPVDALAASAGAGSTAWTDARRPGAAAVLLFAVVAAGLLAFDASPLAALLAALGAGGAVACAGRLTRGLPADPDAAFAVARTVALAGVPLAAAAGWAALPGPGAVLLAAAAGGVAAAAAQVAVRVVVPALVATGVLTTAVAGASIAVQLGVASGAATTAVGALALVLGPLLPRAALRMAGLPRPLVPAGGPELVDADDGPDVLPPDELAERADLARGFLAGLVQGDAIVAATAAVVAAEVDGGAGWVFAALTVVVLGLRARTYADPGPAHACVVAAVAAGLLLAVFAAGAGGPARPLTAAALLLVGALGLAALGAPGPQRPWAGSPVLRRTIDLVEGVAVAASVPAALAAMDLFRVVRAL